MPFRPYNSETGTFDPPSESDSNSGFRPYVPSDSNQPQQPAQNKKGMIPAAMSASSHILSSIAQFGKDTSSGFSMNAIKSTLGTGGMVESGLDETVGRGINLAEGKGNVPTQTGQQETNFLNQDALQPKNTGEKIGSALETGVELAVPGEEVAGAASKLPKEALENMGKLSPIAKKVAGIFGNEGVQKEQAVKKVSDDAWKILAPRRTPTIEKAYRATDNITPRTTFKGSEFTPNKADAKMIEATKPLIESGELKASDPPEVQHKVIGQKVSDMNNGIKKYVADNNKDIDMGDVDARLSDAKGQNKTVFGNDSTVEGVYDSAIDHFKSFIKTEDTKGMLSARQAFDKSMKTKFPNLFKKTAAGEMNPSDNARLAAIRDVRNIGNDVISESLPEGNPYKETLKNETNLLSAMGRIEHNATGTQGKSAISLWLKKHPGITTSVKWVSAGALGAELSDVLHKSLSSGE